MQDSWRWWVFTSLLVHSALVSFGFVAARRIEQHRAHVLVATTAPVEIDFPLRTEQPSSAENPRPTPVPETQPPTLGGAHNAQNIDTLNRGERGDGRSEEQGRLLAWRAQNVNLSTDTINTLTTEQENRLRTSRLRASPQDRRSTPNPGYDPWIGSAGGILLFRLPAATQLPARGAVATPGIAVRAGNAPTTTPAATVDGIALQNARIAGGTVRPSAGTAAREQGTVHRTAGPVANGRASIQQGHASTTAPLDAQRPSDDVEAEALALTLQSNAINTSVHAGPTRAAGEGGVGGGGAPGSGGGTDRGGRARPYGEGNGWLSLASPDERYQHYFQRLRRAIDPLWENAFPREDMLRLRQGTVILHFIIQSDGSVRSVAIQRRSGIDAFDRNVAAAISNAHLPPIPPSLQLSELRLSHSFEFSNPIVH